MFADRPDLKELVTPNHPFFAKRPVKADGFYDALLQDNVTFVRSPVTSVDPDAIVDANGKRYEVDAIVFATGFRVADFLREMEVFGRGGVSIHEFWDAQGGPEAFLGLTVPKFPNFYMLYGPNTNMGQIVFNLETQARFVARDLRRMRRTGATSLEVRGFAHREFNRRLQIALRKTVWPEANNYLKASTGKLVVPFPRPMAYYWALTRLLRRLSAKSARVRVAPAKTTDVGQETRPLAGSGAAG
jgi:cation diffusion facilitator CzcD-associated flavoprotein CzcO